jgi:integrin alpha FG-GAP repeat containing protein 1
LLTSVWLFPTNDPDFLNVLDRDGTIDIIFPSCNHVDVSTGVGTDCFINVAYNQQLGLCLSKSRTNDTRLCRRPEDLCIADPDFKFDLTDDPKNEAFVRFPVSSIFPSTSLLVYDASFTPPLPIPLKLGDADLDGFPDMDVTILHVCCIQFHARQV